MVPIHAPYDIDVVLDQVRGGPVEVLLLALVTGEHAVPCDLEHAAVRGEKSVLPGRRDRFCGVAFKIELIDMLPALHENLTGIGDRDGIDIAVYRYGRGQLVQLFVEHVQFVFIKIYPVRGNEIVGRHRITKINIQRFCICKQCFQENILSRCIVFSDDTVFFTSFGFFSIFRGIRFAENDYIISIGIQ